jgi:hypothetical protein
MIDCFHHFLNQEMIPIAPLDVMRFGNALPQLLHHVVLADLYHGPVQLIIKVNTADGSFYHIGFCPEDVLKLVMGLPLNSGQHQLLAFPITLQVSWINFPPISKTSQNPLPTLPMRVF